MQCGTGPDEWVREREEGRENERKGERMNGREGERCSAALARAILPGLPASRGAVFQIARQD